MSMYSLDFIYSLKSKYENEIINNDKMSNFLNIYQTICQKDAVNPIFCETVTYNQFSSHNVRKFKRKQDKIFINMLNANDAHQSNENAWIPFKKHTGNKQLLIIIKSILNKISPSNYYELITELLSKLEQYNDISILEIISCEIYNKAIFDVQYQDIYIDFCNLLWTNYKWQDNLFDIIVSDDVENQYYFYIHDEKMDEPKLNGPYNNELMAFQQARINVSFKSYFINYLQNKYNNINVYIDKIKNNDNNESELFKYKRNIFGTLELIAKMYIKKYISSKIIHVCFLNLLAYFNNNIIEEYLEGFQKMWLIVLEGDNIAVKYLQQYLNRIIYIKNNFKLSTRINFILTDLIDNYNQRKNIKQNITCSNNMESNCNDTLLNNTALNGLNIETILTEYKETRNFYWLTTKLNTMYMWGTIENWNDMLLYLCENPILIDDVSKLMSEEIKNKTKLMKEIDTFLENIEDIELDIPDANKHISYLIEKIK